MNGFFRTLVCVPIRLYQRYFSPCFGHACRFEPTCSQYAIDAVERYGVVRGLIRAGWRILRCNPLFPGGIDPA
ncbi:MAG: membrane protein insertion efficiency factor YidD [Deltaproteobacteria bacterium]|nr:membrane protein insertion efficiency factor YidD [Candidatus Anaeroferrophillacea bacterium]